MPVKKSELGVSSYIKVIQTDYTDEAHSILPGKKANAIIYQRITAEDTGAFDNVFVVPNANGVDMIGMNYTSAANASILTGITNDFFRFQNQFCFRLK